MYKVKVVVKRQGTQVHTRKEPNIQQSPYDLCKFKNNIMERQCERTMHDNLLANPMPTVKLHILTYKAFEGQTSRNRSTNSSFTFRS
jgi:hypothetical protein